MAEYDFDAMRYHPQYVQRSIERRWLDVGSFDASQTPQGLDYWNKRVALPLDDEALSVLMAMEELHADLRLAHKMAGMM